MILYDSMFHCVLYTYSLSEIEVHIKYNWKINHMADKHQLYLQLSYQKGQTFYTSDPNSSDK